MTIARGYPGIADVSTPTDGSTCRSNAGFIAPGQSAKNFTGKIGLSGSGTTTQVLGQVGTGNIVFFTDIYLSADSSQQLDVQLQAGPSGGPFVTIARAIVKGDTGPINWAGIECPPFATQGQVYQILWPTQATPPNAYFYVGATEQSL